ncbi:MAG: carbamoyltransferase HypF [Bacteroidales bacterium]
MKGDEQRTYRIQIAGLVQGVGFRPFLYRLAHNHQLTGWVKNTGSGVELRVSSSKDNLRKFIDCIPEMAPRASQLAHIDVEQIDAESFPDFRIIDSEGANRDITLVSPDIAVCEDCLEDMKNQEHRLDYPFINCTNCGPRFSIIQALPYDRPNTTMQSFMMCETCETEYRDILDRRFHAQPVACAKCGPAYSLVKGQEEFNSLDKILDETVYLLETGGIVAVKGVGGFHLMCDASSETAVKRLRNAKLREGKPFAVLFRDMEVLRRYTRITGMEEEYIAGWERPIMILSSAGLLASSVSNGFSTVGAMLPYTPFHYKLFEKTKLEALVLTSGNLSDEPIVTDNRQAIEILGPITDACLLYNRDIHNRTDDSVYHLVNQRPRAIRRSRGFAPSPVRVKQQVEGIVAMGAELANCFAVGRKDLVFLSQHIGDLKNFETYEFFLESLKRFKKLFKVEPHLLVADLHPDYLSTQYALNTGQPVMRVQHHHAHVAACMAENGIDGPVIGVAFDGTGLGDDGTIWGGEFLLCDYRGYRREFHLPGILLPGGDKVTSEPWRTAVSLLFQEYGNDFIKLDLPFLKHIESQQLQLVISALEKGINVPASTSAGRWFDAVAALTAVCLNAGFHAEAPMRLEDCIMPDVTEAYSFEIGQDELILMGTLSAIIRDVLDKKPTPLIAAKFHNTMVRLIAETCRQIASVTDVKSVVLSGGSFQNRYLLARTERLVESMGLKVFSHSRIPSNDGGIALGQMVIAASRR